MCYRHRQAIVKEDKSYIKGLFFFILNIFIKTLDILPGVWYYIDTTKKLTSKYKRKEGKNESKQ